MYTRTLDVAIEPHLTDARLRSLELLEFSRIRELLAERTLLPMARERAETLEPQHEARAIQQLQEEAAEARAFLDANGDPGLTLGSDPRPLLTRLAAQATLSGSELLAVGEVLDLLRHVKALGGGASAKGQILRTLARNIPDLRHLEREIRAKITPNGDVADDATPFLRELRHESRATYRRATRALDLLLQTDVVQEALQDSLVTVRSDRLVIPIKADFKGRIGGIVHAVSDSGATLYVEPFSSVGPTNAWREAIAAEEAEVLRILRALSSRVGKQVGDIQYGLEMAARIDLALAKARLARSYQGVTVEPSTPWRIRLVDGRHPLLTGSVVPVSLAIEEPTMGLVITGPNTGGKTVALKTLGLLTLMHQAGLQIPCDPATQLPIFDNVLADIGDQQSIAQAVSTFSSHISSMVRILEVATSRSLVLLDELGTSTDPEEGSALARAILEYLVNRRIPCIVTTHHRAVAALAEEHPALENACVELDPTTMEPTYRLVLGLPGRSYAIQVAERIGLPKEILESARAYQDPNHRAAESLLSTLQQERHQTRQHLEEAERAQREAESLRQELDKQLEEMSRARAEVTREVRQELEREAERVLEKLRQAEAAAAWQPMVESRFANQEDVDFEAARDSVAEAQHELKTASWGQRGWLADHKRMLIPGDIVQIGSLGFTGRVIAAPDDDGKVEVQLGSAKVRLEVERVQKVGQQGSPPRPELTRIDLNDTGPVFTAVAELDLRGHRVHEALEKLDSFLDAALAQGRGSARIIHGKGTGALRQAVWKHLATHGAVASYDFAPREAGGDGATEVVF